MCLASGAGAFEIYKWARPLHDGMWHVGCSAYFSHPTTSLSWNNAVHAARVEAGQDPARPVLYLGTDATRMESRPASGAIVGQTCLLEDACMPAEREHRMEILLLSEPGRPTVEVWGQPEIRKYPGGFRLVQTLVQDWPDEILAEGAVFEWSRGGTGQIVSVVEPVDGPRLRRHLAGCVNSHIQRRLNQMATSLDRRLVPDRIR